MPILVEGPLDRLAIRQAAGNLAIVGLAPSAPRSPTTRPANSPTASAPVDLRVCQLV